MLFLPSERWDVCAACVQSGFFAPTSAGPDLSSAELQDRYRYLVSIQIFVCFRYIGKFLTYIYPGAPALSTSMDLISSNTCTYQLCMCRHPGRQKVVEGLMEKAPFARFYLQNICHVAPSPAWHRAVMVLAMGHSPLPCLLCRGRTNRSEMWI